MSGIIDEYPRDFKGVWFPKEIWLNEKLTLIEKVVLVEIQSLDCGIDGCYATNSYIAKFCQCSSRKASDAISKLDQLELIRVWYDDKNARHIKVNEWRLREAFNRFDEEVEISARVENSARGGSKICEGGAQNLLPINISINNNDNKKNIYTKKDEGAKEEKPKKKKESKHKYGEYSHVTLTDKEYNTLVKENGEEIVVLAIKNMDEWCEMKGKTYRNYYLALRKWGIEAVKERMKNGNKNKYTKQTSEHGAGATLSTDPWADFTEEQRREFLDTYNEQREEGLPWL